MARAGSWPIGLEARLCARRARTSLGFRPVYSMSHYSGQPPDHIWDPNRISKDSTHLSNTGHVNRIWIRFVAHLKNMLRAKARERCAKGRRKGCFWEKEYWTTPNWDQIKDCLFSLPSSLLQALFLLASCLELGLKATTSHCSRRWLCWPGCMRQAMKEILLAGDTNRIWVRIPVNCFPSGYLPVTLGSVPNVCPFSPFEMRRRHSQKHLQAIISRRASPQTRVL